MPAEHINHIFEIVKVLAPWVVTSISVFGNVLFVFAKTKYKDDQEKQDKEQLDSKKEYEEKLKALNNLLEEKIINITKAIDVEFEHLDEIMSERNKNFDNDMKSLYESITIIQNKQIEMSFLLGQIETELLWLKKINEK